LIASQKENEDIKKQAQKIKDEAEKQLVAVKKESDDRFEKLKNEMKNSNSDSKAAIETAVVAATAELKKKNDSLAEDIRKVKDQNDANVSKYEAKLASQIEEFRNQISAVRSGAVSSLAATDLERRSADQATSLLNIGAKAYFEGSYTEAITQLNESTRLNPTDARAWYFLGLSQFASGNRMAAYESYKTGSKHEARSATVSRQVGAALERVQGQERVTLENFRP
jgi:tetratricopeptide (TPR) repeat protein